MTSPLDEVFEGYAETAKDLMRKWSDYASGVATNLDRGYGLDSASGDLGHVVSLAIETGARLSWEALDAVATLTGAPVGPRFVESEEFTSPLEGARLKLKGDLKDRPGDTLHAAVAKVVPARLAPDATKFKLRVDAAECPAGVYRGTVVARTQDDEKDVPVQIKVP
jgi:hypothetical protein